jgi:hypothetical protein
MHYLLTGTHAAIYCSVYGCFLSILLMKRKEKSFVYRFFIFLKFSSLCKEYLLSCIKRKTFVEKFPFFIMDDINGKTPGFDRRADGRTDRQTDRQMCRDTIGMSKDEQTR